MKQQHYSFQPHSIHWETPLVISHINTYHCKASTQNFLSGHAYPKLLYICSGHGKIELCHEVYTLKKNELFLINQTEAGCTVEPEDGPVEFIVIGFHGIEFHFPIEDNNLIMRYSISDNDSLFFINKILEEIRGSLPRYQQASSYYLNLLFICLQRDYGISCRQVTKEKANKDCEMIRDYIDNHYRENITLDLLAEVSNMNKYYLVHSFTNNYGCSPISYLNEKKIEESKHLLETTRHSIADIAKMIGFSSQSYFSQSFKKHTYMTPNEYRRSTRHHR